ncbi:hypothetical protein LLE49_15240 [Alicyclobacillus tolerans]|uniref:hypothetical protein n=1 Tax=Alicyclobacillus tolerans TaxID=90970 RepID=UPI001F46E8FE|nr:hypothetical protein [Alicyclobacillus tolerans]MCF8566079.1 hypothetical protein [Alicyclobacillus tolerans]
MQDDDDKMREVFSGMTEVPFPPELKDRILELAQNQTQPVGKRKRQLWRAVFTGAGGVAAAALVIAAALGGLKFSSLKTANKPVSQGVHQTVKSAPTKPQSGQYGLQLAPIQVKQLRIGTQGSGANQSSVVMAVVSNPTQHVVTKTDSFGLLYFTKTASGKLSDSNYRFFVNPPKQAMQPGQAVTWSFLPLGAPMKNGKIDETPHLVFYASHLVPVGQADAVWNSAPVAISNISVVPRQQWKGGQSFQVSFQVMNRSQKPVDLRRDWAVVWFSPGGDAAGSTQFADAGNIRFFDQVTPTPPSAGVLAPGSAVTVSVRDIGSSKSNFLKMTPHVLLLNP